MGGPGRRLAVAAALGATLSLLSLRGLAQTDEAAWIAVVVTPESADRFDARELALVFRRKKLFADDGERLTPVNLPADHPLRRRFSRSVLGQSPEALESYWNQQYFQGVLPPHVVESEAAMLRFVQATPHAVGYLHACHGASQLHTILVIDPAGDLHPPQDAPACEGN